MRIIKFLTIIGIAVLMASCARASKFPDYQVTVTANKVAVTGKLYLHKTMVVFIAHVAGNTGHFVQRNAEKVTCKAFFSYKPDEEGRCMSSGIEIS